MKILLDGVKKRVATVLALALLIGSAVFPARGTAAASPEGIAESSAFTAPVTEKIMAKAQGTVEFEFAGTLSLAPGYTVEQVLNGQTSPSSLSHVMIGAENVTAYPNQAGQIAKLVINGVTPADRMRVGIRTNIADITDNTTFDHAKVDIRSANGFKLSDKKANVSFDISAAKLVTFTVPPGTAQMVVTVDGAELYRTANRLYASQLTPDSSLLQVMSISRAQGNPLYRNVLEISLTPSKDKMRLLNDVTLEQYLYQVVPSEMPASFGLEALKAQAVAARTYALTDYYSNRFADRGFHIDDSTLSQVFNNTAENALITQAVIETAGLIMKSGSELVDARFYSTSGGFGASKHEVWSDNGATTFPGTPIPYLIAKSYTYDKNDPSIMFEMDTSDEQAINSFYKDLSYRGYDSESLYFRWKIGLTGLELQNTINKNLPLRYAADPAFILTRQPDGSFTSQAIPAEGIGTLTDMYVAKRGAGGNIMELIIAGTTGTYKIVKEFNIRFLIRPNKTDTGSANNIIAYRAKGGSTNYDPAGNLNNPSILYSAFFTFDVTRDASGAITGVTFFGGGNGHGAGMSQYGASMLGLNGWTFDQILNSYYSNMQLEPAYSMVASLEIGGLEPMKGGDTRQAAVTAVYRDGTSAPLAGGVSFTSSNPKVAMVDADGVVTAVGKGETVITASFEGVTAEYRLQVTADLVGITVTKLKPMEAGETVKLTVTAHYSDKTNADVTAGAALSSSDPAVATVDASGNVAALLKGKTDITVTYAGRTVVEKLNVHKSNGK